LHPEPWLRGNPFASAILVDGGPDVADRFIADSASPGDVAITADTPWPPRWWSKGSW
jgi:uncharacterized protein YaiI (UPF0178 family)